MTQIETKPSIPGASLRFDSMGAYCDRVVQDLYGGPEARGGLDRVCIRADLSGLTRDSMGTIRGEIIFRHAIRQVGAAVHPAVYEQDFQHYREDGAFDPGAYIQSTLDHVFSRVSSKARCVSEGYTRLSDKSGFLALRRS